MDMTCIGMQDDTTSSLVNDRTAVSCYYCYTQTLAVICLADGSFAFPI